MLFLSFFFTDPATTEIYTLSLHDALPISSDRTRARAAAPSGAAASTGSAISGRATRSGGGEAARSEEHTSELQSRENLVCRLLLEKKKKKKVRRHKI